MESLRDKRQINVISPHGQKKISNPSVFIVGCGGLGCPVSLYLTASGVGEISIIDDDVISVSNLHRQILFDERDVGKPKVMVAAEKLRKINSAARLNVYRDRISKHNAEKYLKGHDLVILGCDNFLTRYIVNDACCRLNIPFINASVQGDEGSLSYFDIEHGCYRCIFPEIPPDLVLPTPEEAGVLGPVVGVIGTTAATLAVRILTGNYEHYLNTIYNFDSTTLQMNTYSFTKESCCPGCKN